MGFERRYNFFFRSTHAGLSKNKNPLNKNKESLRYVPAASFQAESARPNGEVWAWFDMAMKCRVPARKSGFS
jgi:hypothetical protein